MDTCLWSARAALSSRFRFLLASTLRIPSEPSCDAPRAYASTVWAVLPLAISPSLPACLPACLFCLITSSSLPPLGLSQPSIHPHGDAGVDHGFVLKSCGGEYRPNFSILDVHDTECTVTLRSGCQQNAEGECTVAHRATLASVSFRPGEIHVVPRELCVEPEWMIVNARAPLQLQ